MLTNQDHWRNRHRRIGTHKPSWKDRIRLRVGADSRDSYPDFQVFKFIAKHVPMAKPGHKLLEIGCAPGRYMLRMWRMLGYEPHGVDYSKEGVVASRLTLSRNHLKEESTVFYADATSIGFLDEHREGYDVVMSRGLIEHFTGDKLQAMLDAHMHLCKPGGWLIITIPNLFSFSYGYLRRKHSHVLEEHNLTLMTDACAFVRAMARAFKDYPAFTNIHFGQVGTWAWFGPGNKSKLNALLDLLCFALLWGYDIPSRWSPQFVCVARKKG